MEVITLDSDAFHAIMDKLDKISEHLKEYELKQKIIGGAMDAWLNTEELSDALRVSPRTLQRMRTAGELPFTFIKHRCCYRASVVSRLIDEKIIVCDKILAENFKQMYLSVYPLRVKQ